MITIELPRLNAETALTAATGAIENICDEYALNDHFGTLSLAVTEMLQSIFAYAQDTAPEVDLNFQIDKKDVAVEFHCYCDTAQIKCEVDKGEAACDEIYTILRLADSITFPADNDIRMEFAMQPHFAATNIEHTAHARTEQTYNVF